MKQTNTNVMITCGCCGKKSGQRYISSIYYDNRFLDGKPEYPEFLAPLMRCPHCNYISYHLSEGSEAAKEVVVSEDYQELLRAIEANPICIYEAVLQTDSDPKNLLFLHMQYTWALEFLGNGEDAMRCRTAANTYFEKNLSDSPQIPMILQYIDSLRQQANFTNARALSDSITLYLESYKEEYPLEARLLMFEKELIMNEDSAPHLLSEV